MFGWRNKIQDAPVSSSAPQRLGSYQLGQQIGKGGAGSVFLATHIETGQIVAVKRLRHHAAQNEQFDRRFLREIAILQRISHPHLLNYLDCGIDEHGAYILMEYAERGTLADMLNQYSLLPAKTVVQYTLQLARAIDYLHAQGIIHRDLKPANIFFVADQQLKLGDFGLALDSSKASLTVAGMTVGSVLYMSPEQIRGLKATPASDLYSLGCVLFEMLYGVPPFKLNDPYSIMSSHLESPVKFPDSHLAQQDPLTQAVRTLIEDLLQKSPERRPASAIEIDHRLQQLIV